jgi:hypothetical protein
VGPKARLPMVEQQLNTAVGEWPVRVLSITTFYVLLLLLRTAVQDAEFWTATSLD